MSFAYAPRYGAGLMLGAGLSIGVHGALVALWLTQAAAYEPPEEAGIQGRELIDLAEVEMIMAAPETDLPDGPPAEDSQATLESPAEREEAKASNDPLLAQIPHTPDDPELQFKIANPDQEVDTDKEATETPTELQEETENENAAQSTAAAPKASAGQDEQDQSAAKEQGLAKIAGSGVDRRQGFPPPRPRGPRRGDHNRGLHAGSIRSDQSARGVQILRLASVGSGGAGYL